MSKHTKVGFSFEQVCLSFIEKCRFYTVILSKINKVAYKGVATAGVGFNKHGKLTMYYNPDFMAKLPLAEAQGLVEHECNHIIFRHLTRFPFSSTAVGGIKGISDLTQEKIKGILKEQQDNKIINWGTDMSINQYIPILPKFQADDEAVKKGFAKAGDNMGIYPETHGFPRECAADVYIELLRKKLKEEEKNQQKQPKCQTCAGKGKLAPPKPQPQGGKQAKNDKGDQESDDGQDGNQPGPQGKGEGQDGNQPGQGQGEPCPDCSGSGNQQSPELDSHDLWGKVIEVDEDGNATSIGEVKDNPDIDPEFECEAVVMKAIKECKDWGKIPAHIQAEIDRLKTVKRHDWKKTLRVFVNTVLTVNKRQTQKRVNKRLSTIVEYLAPGKKKARRPRVLYVRDTSGSLFSSEVQDDISNELEQIAKRADVWAADADTDIKQYYRFKTGKDLKNFKGNGGTCFKAAFELARKLGVDGIIYATDTYGTFPEVKDIGKLAKATIWLTFGQEDAKLPFGKHVDIDPAEYQGLDKKKKKSA